MKFLGIILIIFTSTIAFNQDLSFLKSLDNNLLKYKTEIWILVDSSDQLLYLMNDSICTEQYQISTARNGMGCQKESLKTPIGAHRVKNKYGEDAEKGAIFIGRKNTKKIAKIISDSVDTPEDYITSRILWLEGLEKGVNKGGHVDSFERFIYIHGTHEEGLIGAPASHGCIRMRNNDVIELYQNIYLDSFVFIQF